MNLCTQKDQEPSSAPQEFPSLQGATKRSGSVQQTDETSPSLSWTVWPAMENPLRSAAVVIFLAVVIWAIASWFGRAWIFISAIILLLSLAGFFFPTHYWLDQESASARGLISRKKRYWNGFQKCYVGKKGVHLSQQSKAAGLLGSRSIYLPFGENKKEILDFIAEMMDRGR